MRKRLSAAALAASLVLAPVAAGAAEARRAEILNLLRQDCGSCHGLTMRGGLGPSLRPEVIAQRDEAQLVQVILEGRRGTPMPPWRDFLSEAEARWIVEQLRHGLPDAR